MSHVLLERTCIPIIGFFTTAGTLVPVLGTYVTILRISKQDGYGVFMAFKYRNTGRRL
jgi:hypothetical protein